MSNQMQAANGMLTYRLSKVPFWGPSVGVVTLWPPSGDGLKQTGSLGRTANTRLLDRFNESRAGAMFLRLAVGSIAQ